MGIWRGIFGAGLVVALLAAGLGFSAVGAADGTVVINEIYYNQPDGDLGQDFIELHNPGATDIDLTGYTVDDDNSFEPDGDGVVETLTLSGILPAGGYAYVTRASDGFDALAFWGVAPFATMEFGLGGGGDTVTVRNHDGDVVDEVVYDDGAPWPGEPDGDGPSLELINALADNSVPNAWGASDGDPTPGVVNSIAGTTPAEPIGNVVATPQAPDAGQDITVVANVPGETAPTLSYVVDFGTEAAITMTDDGVAPDLSLIHI